MHDPYPGQIVVTADDRGPLANVGAWITMVSMILFALCKIVTKALCTGRFQKDDLYMCLAVFTGIITVIFVSEQVKEGLGRHMTTVSNPQRLQQFAMVSETFYIVTLCLAQTSVLNYIKFLSRDSRHRRAAQTMLVLTLIWAMIGFLNVVFQCGASTPWAIFGDKCFDQIKFWTAWTIIDAALNIAIALLPVFLLLKIRIATSSKIGILMAFAARILAIPVAIARLVFMYRTRNRSDLSFTMLEVTLLATIHMNISVVLTCIPFLKPVLDGLQSGIWGGEVRKASLSRAFSATLSLTRRTERRPSKATMVSEKHRKSIGGKGGISKAYVESGPVTNRTISEDSISPMVINQTTTITIEGDHFEESREEL